jgi:hypothetical protein
MSVFLGTRRSYQEHGAYVAQAFFKVSLFRVQYSLFGLLPSYDVGDLCHETGRARYEMNFSCFKVYFPQISHQTIPVKRLISHFYIPWGQRDRLCGLVVRIFGC